MKFIKIQELTVAAIHAMIALAKIVIDPTPQSTILILALNAI